MIGDFPLFIAAPRALWLLLGVAAWILLEVRWHRRQHDVMAHWRRNLVVRSTVVAMIVLSISHPCWRLAIAPAPMGHAEGTTLLPLWPYLLTLAALGIPLDAWIRRLA